MRYALDCKDDFASNLLFWIERFIYGKINSLSNHQVKNKDEILKVLARFRSGFDSMESLQEVCKECRNVGLIGINTYCNPLAKLYEYLTAFPLKSLKEVDEEMLKEFLTIHTSALADATKKNYRMALINFFGFVDKQNEYDL